jgi:hypothetical protein
MKVEERHQIVVVPKMKLHTMANARNPALPVLHKGRNRSFVILKQVLTQKCAAL